MTLDERSLFAAMAEIRKMFLDQVAMKKDYPRKIMAFGKDNLDKAMAMVNR